MWSTPPWQPWLFQVVRVPIQDPGVSSQGMGCSFNVVVLFKVCFFYFSNDNHVTKYNCSNHTIFVHNVCMKSKFWPKSGNDQLALLWFDEIQYFIWLPKFSLLIIIWSKRQKCVYVLILNFDHEESFTNISHYNRIKHKT